MITRVTGRVLAIDPGSANSAWVQYEGGKILAHGIEKNSAILDRISYANDQETGTLLIEMIASYGMPVGREVFETCVWSGRFIQAHEGNYRLIYRKDVKMHLCGSMRAKDGNVRQAIMDRYGSSRALAIGTKRAPGALYGVSKDIWSAIAVAITGTET